MPQPSAQAQHVPPACSLLFRTGRHASCACPRNLDRIQSVSLQSSMFFPLISHGMLQADVIFRQFQASGARKPRTSGSWEDVGLAFHDTYRTHAPSKRGKEWIATFTMRPIIALGRFAKWLWRCPPHGGRYQKPRNDTDFCNPLLSLVPSFTTGPSSNTHRHNSPTFDDSTMVPKVLGVLILAHSGDRSEFFQDPYSYAPSFTESTPLGAVRVAIFSASTKSADMLG